LYIARTSEVAGVSRETLIRELQTAPRERRTPIESGAPPVEPVARVRQGDRRLNHRARGVRAERELVRMLLHQRRYIETVGERIGADAFSDLAYRAIFAALTAHDADAPLEELASELDEDATEVLQELMNENGGLDRAEETIEAGINALLSRDLAARMTEIDRLLPLAPADEKDDLIREKSRLAAEMQALGRPRWKSFNSTRS
jgi:hypothetical protein